MSSHTSTTVAGQYDPETTMVMRDVLPGITTLSTPFDLAGKIKNGGRATLVQLQTGHVAVFSPVTLTTAVREKIRSLGPVKYIIALNVEHHLFITQWAHEFPDALVIGMEGLPEKRQASEATRDTHFGCVFTSENKRQTRISGEFDVEFDYEFIHAHKNKELVFFHKPTGTLIEADLIFNLPAVEQYSKTNVDPSAGLITMFAGGLLNTRDGAKWQRRLLYYVNGSKDRPDMKQSLERALAWNFDRIICCHGDVIETGGKAVFEEVTSLFLK